MDIYTLDRFKKLEKQLAELEARVAALEARTTPNPLGPGVIQPREYPGDWPTPAITCEGPAPTFIS